jgi:hypothetical protein
MEALTAVIDAIRLIEENGGKSGHYRAGELQQLRRPGAMPPLRNQANCIARRQRARRDGRWRYVSGVVKGFGRRP